MTASTKTSVILLAGGVGSRMQNLTPKQFLQLGEKPLVKHSFDLFISLDEIDEIVVICSPDFQHYFENKNTKKHIIFALPGKRRQDSVYNGLLVSSPNNQFICVHDGARPFIDKNLVLRVLHAAQVYQAAAVGMPIKYTVKMSCSQNFVTTTPDRSLIWEIQTPQVIRRDLLIAGFDHAIKNDLTVTDDVSLVEHLGHKVKLVEGSHHNLKITVPEDLTIATQLLKLTNYAS